MADTKITALTAVGTIAGDNTFPIAEDPSGTPLSRKITLSQVAAFGPTVPTIIVGAEFSGTGVPTATLPAGHTTNDILLLLLQSSNESNITAPAGYQQLGPQNAIGAAATAGTTKLSIFWKRHSGSESAPTIPDTGDHTYGVMLAVRGCITTGDPFHFLGNAWEFTTSTTGTGPRGRTSVDDCLVLTIFGHGIDNASAQASSPTNSSLSSVTEQFDDGTTDGTGGGICVVSGVKEEAGEVTATTVTWANTTVDVSSMIAFIPVGVNPNHTMARSCEVQTFIGTAADLDDTWVKPTGACRVFAQICDGGASGSGGNITTTAAGGGGGGGGGYDEAWFRAGDLAATVTVHAGRGAVAGVALNANGTAGVLSEFDKGGGSGAPLSSSRRVAQAVATAAASANGGDGGSGSGRGRASPAAGTRADLLAGVSAAFGAVGGRGGNGSTATVGGSPGDWGGGGGESGADTDAATTSDLNGWSMRGGGGGSSGRTNTNISGSGHGGGAAGVISAQGAAGTDSTRLPYGGSGGVGGGSSVVTGGPGGFPGGGGGGGAGVAGGFGGRGGHGCVVVTTFF